MAQRTQVSKKKRIESATDLWACIQRIVGECKNPHAVCVEDANGDYIQSVWLRTDILSDGSTVETLVISSKAGV